MANMTNEELLNATSLHLNCTFEVGPRGGIKEHHIVWEVTNVKRWVRDPERFDMTLHHGLKGWIHVTDLDQLSNGVYLSERCPAALASQAYRERHG